MSITIHNIELSCVHYDKIYANCIVFVGQYGKSLPLCYCMQPSYWKSLSRRRRLSPQRVYTEPVENISDCPHIEPVTEDMKNLNKLQLIDIKKTYKVAGKNLEAVKGMTINNGQNCGTYYLILVFFILSCLHCDLVRKFL